jgi:KaiC/GvpD/RAD55 family RecA-like ATPase
MRMKFDGRDLNDILEEDIGRGRMILLEYDPGSGGEVFVKQFFSEAESGYNSILISTREEEHEIMRCLGEYDLECGGVIVSLLPHTLEELNRIKRKDKFITEGILVTDLLELGNSTGDPRMNYSSCQKMLAEISSVASRQITPFRMAIDTLSDLTLRCEIGEIRHRLEIIRESVRKNQGYCVVANMTDGPIDTTLLPLFDAMVSIEVSREGDVWKRYLMVNHVRNVLKFPKKIRITSGTIPQAPPLEE